MPHSMYREGVPEAVGADSPCLPRFWVDQFADACSPGALSDHLPSLVAIDAEYAHLPISVYRATALDVTSEHPQAVTIYRQGS